MPVPFTPIVSMTLRFSLIAALAALVALPLAAQAPLQAQSQRPDFAGIAARGGMGAPFTGVLVGSKEVPANASTARGYAYGLFDSATNGLRVFVPVTGLTGTFQAAHIHRGAAGVNGPVLYPATTIDVQGADVSLDFDVTLTASQVTDLMAGNLYVNVHSSAFPGGEVRTQLTASSLLSDVRTAGVGATITTLAYVTRAMGAFTYIGDDTAGLAIRQTSGPWFDAVQSGAIQPGTVVRVTGTLSEFRGLLQINQASATANDLASFEIANDVNFNVNFVAQQVTLADIAANGEMFESTLVVVTDATIDGGAGGTFAPGTNHTLTDGSTPASAVVLRVPSASDTEVDGQTIPTAPATVLGIVGQFVPTGGSPTENYRILVIEDYDVNPTGTIQVIHNAADPALATIDVFVDGVRVIDDLTFRTATGPVSLPAFAFLPIEVRDAAGTTILIGSGAFLVPGGEPIVVVAQGVGNPALFAANPDGRDITADLFGYGTTMAPDASSVGVLAVHGATDAPTIDLRSGGTVLVDDAAYGDGAPVVAPNANLVLVVTTADGSTVVGSFQADLTALGGQTLTVLASGFLNPAANQNGPAFGLLAVRPDGTAFLLPRVVAAGEGAESGLALAVGPNPTAGAATVAFALDTPGDATVAVYDALGRTVATLATGAQAAGAQQATLDGLAPGVYVVRLTAGDRVVTRMLTVVR